MLITQITTLYKEFENLLKCDFGSSIESILEMFYDKIPECSGLLFFLNLSQYCTELSTNAWDALLPPNFIVRNFVEGCSNCAFLQYFHIMKLGEILVFYEEY